MLAEKSFFLYAKQSDAGHLAVKRVDQILRDGVVISETYHRCVLSPGDDLSEAERLLTQAADASEVIAVARVIHTPEAVRAYRAQVEARQNTAPVALRP